MLSTDTLEDDPKLGGTIPIQVFSPQACKELRKKGIDIAFYASKELSLKDPVMVTISVIFPTVYYVLPESNLSSLWVDVTDLLGRPALKIRYHLLEKIPNLAKRILELVISGILAMFTLPLTMILALIIFLEDKGPVFYFQDRLGMNGKPFRLIKFRTMKNDSEKALLAFLKDNPQAYLEFSNFHKLDNDPRITKAGAFLRRFSIDELPQLINVFRGEMNLIGPRAYMLHELDLKDELTQTILRVKPGVSGWWQVMGRSNTTFAERLKLDFYYITNWSLWMDYFIFIKTIWIVMSGKGK
jgi:lipopolysaccharide/colanic/teichoic acid biosynthesis glycosyltransferase